MCESIPFPVYVRAAHLMFSTTIATSSSGSAFLQLLDDVQENAELIWTSDMQVR